MNRHSTVLAHSLKEVKAFRFIPIREQGEIHSL